MSQLPPFTTDFPTYIAGQVILTEAYFTDPACECGIDPSGEVALQWAVNGELTPKITYSGGSGPILRISEGLYSYQIDTTTFAEGLLTYQWWSTGTGQAVGRKTVYIISPSFPIT